MYRVVKREADIYGKTRNTEAAVLKLGLNASSSKQESEPGVLHLRWILYVLYVMYVLYIGEIMPLYAVKICPTISSIFCV